MASPITAMRFPGIGHIIVRSWWCPRRGATTFPIRRMTVQIAAMESAINRTRLHAWRTMSGGRVFHLMKSVLGLMGESLPRGGRFRYRRSPMPLLVESRLGPYRIVARLGAGGMGEHSSDLVFLNTEAYLDPVRGDPRFQAMVRRVGLTPRA